MESPLPDRGEGQGEGGTAIYKPASWLDPLDWQEVFSDPVKRAALSAPSSEALRRSEPARPTNDIRPVEIDVGCGKGGFLVWSARTRPGHNFLGIERQLVRLHKVDKKIQRAKLANVRLLRVEASYLISKLVPDKSVAVYHILFPDPWPKRRHAKHRLFQPAFVDDLYRTLGQGGVVNVATDDADYFVRIREVMARKFVETPPEVLPAEAMTEFEKIFVAQGKKIGRAKFVVRNP